MRTSTLLLAGLGLFAGAVAASPTTITYSDFSSTSGLQLNGDAATAGGALRLTDSTWQGGSAFMSNAIALGNGASFSSYFTFRISNPMGGSDGDGIGADGLVFVVQTLANNVGGQGGGIGYQGIANSIGIEFDTWDNGWGDGYNGNHVGLNLNGNVNSVTRVNEAQRFNDGDIWHSWIDYNSVTGQLEVRYGSDSTRPAQAALSYNLNLAGILGSNNAFVGFTSGTGAAGGYHDILSWTFINDFDPIDPDPVDVPLPATAALFGLGLLAMRRRRTA